MIKRLLCGLGWGSVLIVQCAIASNVTVTNTDLTSPGAATVKVEFDISWENSWRDSITHDACWVFVKYSTDSGATWNHATLGGSGTNPAGFATGTGTDLDIVVPTDRTGGFVQRSSSGTGTVSVTGMQFVWDFNSNGVSAGASARVKVFATEMVYCSEGDFEAGSGGSGANEFTKTTISNANATAAAGGYPAGETAPDNASWPNGYSAFYCMKFEISQRQYCDFLNTLTAQQQGNRHDNALHFNSSRNFIKKTSDSPAFFGCDAGNDAGAATSATAADLNEANDGEWAACTYISWGDGAAYADWAGLRPMTELEFEKACRGPLPAVPDEYAWGDTTVQAPATTSLNNQNTISETPNSGNCNYTSSSPSGPYRCGSFADATSTRVDAGAGYYGVLDMSGNAWERAVTIGHVSGRAFTGVHGNGGLTADGHADTTNWPGMLGGEVTEADGVGFRGGAWNAVAATYLPVSDRAVADAPTYKTRVNSAYGWRAVRSAP